MASYKETTKKVNKNIVKEAIDKVDNKIKTEVAVSKQNALTMSIIFG